MSGRELKPGETFFTVLQPDGGRVLRHDYATEAWTGPPADAIGWWRSQVPHPNSNKVQLAPNDVMLDLLERWESDPEQQDIRYVLSLLLVRRRVLRLEDTEKTETGEEISVLYCPRKDATFRVVTAMPGDERILQIQDQLTQLLYSGSTIQQTQQTTPVKPQGD